MMYVFHIHSFLSKENAKMSKVLRILLEVTSFWQGSIGLCGLFSSGHFMILVMLGNPLPVTPPAIADTVTG